MEVAAAMATKARENFMLNKACKKTKEKVKERKLRLA